MDEMYECSDGEQGDKGDCDALSDVVPVVVVLNVAIRILSASARRPDDGV